MACEGLRVFPCVRAIAIPTGEAREEQTVPPRFHRRLCFHILSHLLQCYRYAKHTGMKHNCQHSGARPSLIAKYCMDDTSRPGRRSLPAVTILSLMRMAWPSPWWTDTCADGCDCRESQTRPQLLINLAQECWRSGLKKPI